MSLGRLWHNLWPGPILIVVAVNASLYLFHLPELLENNKYVVVMVVAVIILGGSELVRRHRRP